MSAAATEDAGSAEYAGAANRLRVFEALAIKPAEGDCAGAEPARGSGEARRGCHQEVRPAAGAALEQDGAAAGRAGCVFPKDGRPVAGLPERRRHAATAAEPDL